MKTHALSLVLILLAALPVLGETRWPAGYGLYHGDPKATSPDGRLDFIVPTGDGYEKGQRCQVVDLKAGKVLHAVDHGEYWNDGDGGLSHGGIRPLWKPDPANKGAWLCAVEFEGKWQPRNLTLLQIGPGDQFEETDVWAGVEKAVAAHAAQGKVPKGAFNENYAVLLIDTKVAWEGDTLVIKGHATSNPKEMETVDDYSFDVAARFDVSKKTLELDAGKVKVRKGTPEK